MTVQVSVGGEVGDDLKGVLGVLEGARRPLPAIGAVAEDGLEDRPGVAFQILPAGVGMREERGRDHLALSVRIVLQEADRRARTSSAVAARCAFGLGTDPRDALGCRCAIALVEGPLDEGRDDQAELAV